MKNNKGITLIALVITIIVLLILAGVSIAMLTGSNGVLTRATEAKDENTRAAIADKVNMSIQAAYTTYIADNPTTTQQIPISNIIAQYNEDYKTDEVEAPAKTGTGNQIEVKDNNVTYTVDLTSATLSYITSTDQVQPKQGE